MKRCFLLALMLVLLSPQISLMFNRPLDDCCGRQLGLRNFGLASASSYVNVNVSVAKQMIETNPNLVILDVRSQSEYDSGHIENATLIPSDQLAGRISELDKQKDILVYCAAGGRSATASQLLVDNGFLNVYNILGGITAWKNAGYWIELVQNGELTVDGTKTFVIENCTYVLGGSVFVRDLANFVMRNSKIVVNQENNLGLQLRCEGNSKVQISNCSVQNDCGWNIMDNCSVTVADSNLVSFGIHGMGFSSFGYSNLSIRRCNLTEVVPFDHSTVSIEDSTFSWTTSLRFDNQDFGKISKLFPGFLDYWNLHDNQTDLNTDCDLTLANTTVAGWSLQFGQDAVGIVENSTIWKMYMGFEATETKISDIRPGLEVTRTIGNVTLLNTDVGHWVFALLNTVATFNGCEGYLGLTGETTVMMMNSEGLYVLGVTNANVAIYANQSNLTVTGDLTESDLYIKGNLGKIILERTPETALDSSNVTRNYGVKTQETNGVSAGDVGLTLYDQNNAVVWNGTTDSIGEADFNITFIDSNCTDTLRLDASKGELFATKNITFLSDTPVTLVMQTTTTADINNDGSVDIYDAILLANAYNSIPSSSNWNSKADLNSDNIVDIYDAIILANHYGKTG